MKGETKQMETKLELREQGYQELQDTPQILNTSEEPLNKENDNGNSVTILSMNSINYSENHCRNSMPCFHFGCGSNTELNKNSVSASLSGTKSNLNSRVFVLSFSGKPLTPCKESRARKMLLDGVARIVWNNLGQFGIQMLVQTREFKPKFVLGIDNGTCYEGISIVSPQEHNLNVMWILPDKKVIVRKLNEEKEIRRARRRRNCRRREARFDNRTRKENFIAPSQFVIVNSRLKYLKEIFKYYPINKVAYEDVKFNHRGKKWGKNFSTMEIGKKLIKDYIKLFVGVEGLISFSGLETQELRKKYNLKKSSHKSSQSFNSHCVDSFVIAFEVLGTNLKLNENEFQLNTNLIYVDDSYRPQRRKKFDNQPAHGKNLEKLKKVYAKGKFSGVYKNGSFFAKYSEGNFKGIRKGTICQYGQIIGGTGNYVYVKDWSEKKQIPINLKKLTWMSKKFKSKFIGGEIHPTNELVGFLS